MQTIPQNPSEATPSLMIELFSRFFSRLLEKEAKYHIFTEQWETFKTLLVKAPFDLDKIYIHLATIQLNLEKFIAPVVETSYKSKLGTETFKIISPATDCSSTTKLGVDISNAISPVVEKSATSTFKFGADIFSAASPIGESPSTLNLITDMPKETSYLDSKVGSPTRSASSSPSRRRSRTANTFHFTTSANATPSPNQPDDQSKNLEIKVPILKAFDRLFESPLDSVRRAETRHGTVVTQRFEISSFPTTTKTNYDVGFLASKARRIKETIEVHSKLVVEASEKGPKSYLTTNFADRTPLRGLIMYARQGDDNGSLFTKGQQPFSEQVNLDLYSYRPSPAVNQMAPYF